MLVMGARGATGYVLGHGAGSAATWWTAGGATNCVAAYQPKGAASLAASYVNLANPGTYDAAPGVAPTWAAATGWTFDGTQYLTTGIVPASLDYTIIAKFSDLDFAYANHYLIGSTNNAVTAAMALAQNNAGQRMWWRGSTIFRNGAPSASGVQALAGDIAYFNGSAVATLSASSDMPTRAFAIGSYNPVAAQGALRGKILALAIYSATLSAAQVAAVTAAMNLL